MPFVADPPSTVTPSGRFVSDANPEPALDQGKDWVSAFLDAIGNQIPGMNHVPNTWGGDEKTAASQIAANSAEHPVANVAGNIVGGTLPYVAGGAATAAAKAPLAVKALVSGGIGAVQGINDTNVDPNASTMDKLEAYLKNGAIGAAGGAGGEYLGHAATGIAQNWAPKVIGATKSIIADMTPAARKKLGISLLNPVGDEQKVITPFAGAETMMGRVQGNKKLNGQMIGQARANADATGNRFDTMGALTDVNGLRSDTPLAPLNFAGDDTIDKAEKTLLEYAVAHGDTPNGNLSLTKAGEIKSGYGNLADYRPSNQGDVPVNDAYKAITGVLKNHIDSGILPEDLPGYQQANEGYSNSLRAQDALTNKMNSDYGNNKIGLPVKTAISIGAGALDPSKVIAPLVIEAADRRGGTAAVSALDAGGKSTLGMVPQGVNAINDYINQNTPGHSEQQGSDDATQ